MSQIPDDLKKLTTFAKDVVEQCGITMGTRANAYRAYGQWIETGRGSAGLSSCNMLHAHIDRLTAHLFSPVSLRFNLTFPNQYLDRILSQAEQSERVLNDTWRFNAIDMVFADCVKMSLGLGAGIMKQTVETVYDKDLERQIFKKVNARSVFPWNFGVGNETENDIAKQEKMDEIVYLSRDQVWRRIYNLPERDKLYQRIITAGDKNSGIGAPGSWMHQVLSTAVLDPSGTAANRPGGIVQLTTSDNMAPVSPEVGEDLYPMHEMYVWDDERADFITIQMIEPDVIICPRLFAPVNLFAPKTLPYDLVQANRVASYMWGRSEIVDLMMPQQMLSTTYDDFKRVMGQQYDKLLYIEGDGINQDTYDMMHMNGWMNGGQGNKVTDLTPQIPAAGLEFINLIKETMGEVSGFQGVMAGMGQGSVRSGLQTDQLTKMGSPRLRDRSLVIERQCAAAAAKTFSAMRAKDAKAYWTDAKDQNRLTDFLLSQLPDDYRVTVDSHSSSPIYQDDQQNTVAFLLKAGAIDASDAMVMLDVPNVDYLIDKLEKRKEAKAAQFAQLQQTNPEEAAKVMAKGGG